MRFVDLAVAAALDAVKESVTLPWKQSAEDLADTKLPVSTEAPTSAEAAAYEGLTATAESVDAEAPHHAGDPASTQTDTAAASTDAAPENAVTPGDATSSASEPEKPQRVLSARHFIRALKEITPSASEHLGTLSDLRKWNDEFGDGAHGRRKRKTAVWGKDRFGFTDRTGREAEPGRVAEEGNKDEHTGK